MSDNEKAIGQISELENQAIDLQDSLQNLIFQNPCSSLEDLSQIKKTKKKIAQTKTFIHQLKLSPKIIRYTKICH